MTQNIGNIVSTIGICLMTFASWQYTLQEPGCCYDSTVNVIGEFDNGSYWSPNCSELHKVILWKDANLHISPTVNMVLAIIGLTVSITMHSYQLHKNWQTNREELGCMNCSVCA